MFKVIQAKIVNVTDFQIVVYRTSSTEEAEVGQSMILW